MKIEHFNFLGEFKTNTPSGNPFCYSEGDVVYYEGKTFIASRTIHGLSPTIGEKAGWISLADKQVLYETTDEPFYPKVGDEWFKTDSGIRYKRIENETNEFWVEI